MFTAIMRILYLTILSCILLLSSSCEENNSTGKSSQVKSNSSQSKNKIVKDPIPEIPEVVLINNDNVSDTLTTYGELNKETIVEITTTMGKIKIRLFDDVPLHRANFIMLCKEHYFDSTIFNRVVPKFMAQCGASSNYKHTDFKRDHGRFTIPAEMNTKHFHKKGAVAMARDYNINPDKRSDPYAFYFVEGQRFMDVTLDIYEEKNKYIYSKEQRKYYKNNPGAAHIDGQHTVFGEIISGYSVIPKITAVDTDRQDWPKDDIYILKTEVIK